MSKLSKDNSFFDLSDYGRPIGQWIARQLEDTFLTPVHITLSFTITGLIAIYCVIQGFYVLATLFLIIKSILDAADGELSRIRNRPSFIGRYTDSIADILLNVFLFIAIGEISHSNVILTLLAFFAIQLQGTVYNFYYVILRNQLKGDQTSKIFETGTPTAFDYEDQRIVTLLFRVYVFLYGTFDKIIYVLDRDAANCKSIPKWFMTTISIYGLGFQLLLIGVFLMAGWINWIIPFFIGYSVFILIFIIIRKVHIK